MSLVDRGLFSCNLISPFGCIPQITAKLISTKGLKVQQCKILYNADLECVSVVL